MKALQKSLSVFAQGKYGEAFPFAIHLDHSLPQSTPDFSTKQIGSAFPSSSYSTPPHFASQGRHCTEAFTSSLQPETAALGQSCATTHWKLTVLCDWGTAQTSLWTKTQWPTILFQRLLEEENPSANSQQKPPLMRALIACLKTSCWP